jgi:hypothetical protein
MRAWFGNWPQKRRRYSAFSWPRRAFRLSMAAMHCCVWLTWAHAQTDDEIQVYNAQIAAPGGFNFTLHNNYTSDGLTGPPFPGGIVANHTLNGVAEWAYGVTNWFEAGVYLPLYSITGTGAWTYNGFKVRALFVKPDAADQRFFYGVNLEFSRNTAHWDQSPNTQEIRTIIGWHLGSYDIIFNPIFENSYQGFSRLDFAPAARVAYNLNKTWAIAAEEYDDFGPLRGFYPASQQQHQLFGVFDYSGKPWMIEAGAGVGLTSATNCLEFKLILSRDLN